MAGRFELRDYKRGAIVRLKVTNFMKHEEATFEFTPMLNFISGTNGSGKSSIVCALILGFCGTPKTTGRCSEMAMYIARGHERAKIKIVLSKGDGENVITLERQLESVGDNKRAKSSFRIDGKSVIERDAKKIIEDLNIDVNNLCQVLPQDRVSEFAQLDAKNLLLNTEKSIGETELFNKHEELTKLSKELRLLTDKKRSTENSIVNIQGYKSTLQTNIEQLKRKEECEKQMELLRKKEAFIILNEKRDDFKREKEELDKKKKEIAKQQKEIEIYNNKCQSLNEIVRSYDEKLTKSRRPHDALHSASAALESVAKTVARERSKIFTEFIDSKNYLIELKNELKRLESQVNLEKDKLLGYQERSGNGAEEMEQLQREVHNLKQEDAEFEAKSEDLKKEKLSALNKLRTSEMQYRELVSQEERIKQRFKGNTLKGIKWVEENRDKFEGEVYPGLILSIRAKKPEYAKYIERVIARRDWEMFLFEKKRDLDLFRAQFDVKNCPPYASIPDEEDSERGFHLEQMKKYGIYASVSDLIQAPPGVFAYLIKTARINTIPVGDETTEQYHEELSQCQAGFRLVLTPKKAIQFTKSRYQNVLSSDFPFLSEAKLLNLLPDTQAKKRAQERIHSAREAHKEIEAKVEEFMKNQPNNSEEILSKKTKINSLRNLVDVIAKSQNIIRSKESEIEATRRHVERLEGKSIKNEQQKFDSLTAKKIQSFDSFFAAFKASTNVLKEEVVISVELGIAEPIKHNMNQSRQELQRTLGQRKEQITALQLDLEDKKRTLKALVEDTSLLMGCDISKANSSEVIELLKLLKDCPDNREEIANLMLTYQAQYDGLPDGDRDALQKFKNYHEQITDLKKTLEMDEAAMTQARTSIEHIKETWKPLLESKIACINATFCNFMRRLGFSGQIDLDSGVQSENEDFENYGIRIRVKFRDSESLSDLTSHSQSGGERSVATIVYLLAIQELAVVPFRIIDEINQGMDGNNERNVFGLFDYVARNNSSQYLLITPKIITGLPYTDSIALTQIFN